MACKNGTSISRYELVEVVIPATVTTDQEFPKTSNLQNDIDQRIVIKDIEVFPVYAQSFSIRTAGTPVLPVLEIPKLSLVLYNLGGEWIRYIPLAKLIYTQPPAGTAAPFQQERVAFDMLEDVAWDKCKVHYNTPAAGLPYVIPFGITYLKFTR